MTHLQHLRLLATAVVAVLLFSQAASAQQASPAIEWEKSFGGNWEDLASSITQTTDGGYIVAGSSQSDDGDVTGHHGRLDIYDYWIVKLTGMGDIEWQKSLGGSDNDYANSIIPTSDSGYIVAGYSVSADGDVTESRGNLDAWVVKLRSTGEIEWQRSLGGSGEDLANSIAQTTDGGYIIAGLSQSDDGDVTGRHEPSFSPDVWIVKLRSTGEIEWQRLLGGKGWDEAKYIAPTRDGGYIITGFSNSNDGDVIGLHGNYGFRDYWIVKLRSTGEIEWQRVLGGSNKD